MKNPFLIGERIYLRPLAEEDLDRSLHTEKGPHPFNLRNFKLQPSTQSPGGPILPR
jgi:hypothetical protein